jgi:hypothetical protein
LSDDSAERRAVDAARSRLGIGADEPARSWKVGRLASGARAFFLVVFGAHERATGVAAVDAETLDVRESARLPGRGAHAVMSADAARAIAGLDDASEATLVWEPSAASRSPLYPLWQLRGADASVWVDAVRGVVFRSLDPNRGVGG